MVSDLLIFIIIVFNSLFMYLWHTLTVLIVIIQLQAVADMNQRDFRTQQEQEERRVSSISDIALAVDAFILLYV